MNIENQKEKLERFVERMKEFLGMTKNGVDVNQPSISLLSGFILSDDISSEFVDSAAKLYIDKYEQAYSMAFFGFSSKSSKAFRTDTFGSRINDDITYNEISQIIANSTEKKNIFKYRINDENWLLSKLEELDKEQDEQKKDAMIMQLPEAIITPDNVKFSDQVTNLLCKYNIRVQRVGMNKAEDSLDLGDVVKYNYKNGMQELNDQSIFRNAMDQLNTMIVESKMSKLRKIQRKRIKEIENHAVGMQSEETIDYILSELEELYKEFDIDTYNHIIGMKQLVSTIDFGMPEDRKLSDNEKKKLERMVVLHDVGKLNIPKQIVGGRELSDYERSIMNSHVSLDNAAMFNNEAINELLSYALNHHMAVDLEAHNETRISNSQQIMDVSKVGYGDKRVADKSNDRLVQMLHVIDVYNALISDRSYKKGFPMETAVKFMMEDVQNGKMNPEYVQYLLNGVELEKQKGMCA